MACKGIEMRENATPYDPHLLLKRTIHFLISKIISLTCFAMYVWSLSLQQLSDILKMLCIFWPKTMRVVAFHVPNLKRKKNIHTTRHDTTWLVFKNLQFAFVFLSLSWVERKSFLIKPKIPFKPVVVFQEWAYEKCVFFSSLLLSDYIKKWSSCWCFLSLCSFRVCALKYFDMTTRH